MLRWCPRNGLPLHALRSHASGQARQIGSSRADWLLRTKKSCWLWPGCPARRSASSDCGQRGSGQHARARCGRPPSRPRPAPAGQPRPPVPHPAALVALAWVHLEHNELREAHNRLKHADAALSVNPDKLIGAVAGLAAAYGALAGPRAAAATQIIATARSGWLVPAWLDQRLSLAESRAYAAAGDIPAALAAAGRAGRDHSPEAAIALAHAWAAAGHAQNATRAFTPVLAAEQRGTRTRSGAGVAGGRSARLPPR